MAAATASPPLWDSGNDTETTYENNFQTPELPVYGDALQRYYEDNKARWNEIYCTWTTDINCPIALEEIWSILGEIVKMFGFQEDAMKNVFELMLSQLDSRASRMGPNLALEKTHEDYICGINANYRKWLFASKLDLEYANPAFTSISGELGDGTGHSTAFIFTDSSKARIEDFKAVEREWVAKMAEEGPERKVAHVALYLLCWTEAGNIRFMPECLSFIFKCALDFYENRCSLGNSDPRILDSTPGLKPAGHNENYLRDVITPIYEFMRNEVYQSQDVRLRTRKRQQTSRIRDKKIRRNRENSHIIGYDDANQQFWHEESLRAIKFQKDSGLMALMSVHPCVRYVYLKAVRWDKSFKKSYKESRTWFHLITNFGRIWILHVTIFWFYTSKNAPWVFSGSDDLNVSPPEHIKWTVIALGGGIGPLVNLLISLTNLYFVSPSIRRNQSVRNALGSSLCLLIVMGLAAYPLGFASWTEPSFIGDVLSYINMTVAILSTVYFSCCPPQRLFSLKYAWTLGFSFTSCAAVFEQRPSPAECFISGFAVLPWRRRLASLGLWAAVLGSKFAESYFFMTLSFRDPVRDLWLSQLPDCPADFLPIRWLCKNQAKVTLCTMAGLDFVLFFLDTYLWYVVISCLLSITIFVINRAWRISPTKGLSTRELVHKIRNKLVNESKGRALLYSALLVWNHIVDDICRDAALSAENAELLRVDVNSDSIKNEMRLSDVLQSQESVVRQAEMVRRISFFARTLQMSLPQTTSIEHMPGFTVLIPQYNETVCATYDELREVGSLSRLSLLGYLKRLFPREWDTFKSDSTGLREGSQSARRDIELWAAKRSQTLWRAVNGISKYHDAIGLLYDAETETTGSRSMQNPSSYAISDHGEAMARRKCRVILALQTYGSSDFEEKLRIQELLTRNRTICIAHIEESQGTYYSMLTEYNASGPCLGSTSVLRIRLPGDPILGDGKSDNQNHALIFYRGEYIQLIDANQDNYLEECLKIRQVLAEFEELGSFTEGKALTTDDFQAKGSPVAIVGAREYVFSENMGLLGDIAAGKEQTFGTFFARSMASVGGKLHYGHPDFLHGIFMTTRGGLSKAQLGLHLNEDIYAGMNALMRGGRIKHCEYYQCGKGRDLGFNSVIAFSSKIGAGMGEQILSREYFHLGCDLDFDRFLSFYYAHAGFHINNVFIILSVRLFKIVTLYIATLTMSTLECLKPDEETCQSFDSVFQWVNRCVQSILVVLGISVLPLFFQETLEKGFFYGLLRILRQHASLSPLFEVFVCHTYAYFLVEDLSLGGAKYVSTGRSLAISRLPFSALYCRYAHVAFYDGAKLFLVQLLLCLSNWRPFVLWFLFHCFALLESPYLFNPHQFLWNLFFEDYKSYLVWLFRPTGSKPEVCWSDYIRRRRATVTGYKDNFAEGRKKPGWWSSFVMITRSLFSAFVVYPLPYFYARSRYSDHDSFVLMAVRLGFLTFAPLVLNACFLAFTSLLALMASLARTTNDTNPSLGTQAQDLTHDAHSGRAVSSSQAAAPGTLVRCTPLQITLLVITRSSAVLVHMAVFAFILVLEQWSFSRAILCLLAIVHLQSLCINLVNWALTREVETPSSTESYWAVNWSHQKSSWRRVSLAMREFLCKSIESTLFARDFIVGHAILVLQAPLLVIPHVDTLHSAMIFWLWVIRDDAESKRCSKAASTGDDEDNASLETNSSYAERFSHSESADSISRLKSRRARQRRRNSVKYAFCFFAVNFVLVAIVIGPVFLPEYVRSTAFEQVSQILGSDR